MGRMIRLLCDYNRPPFYYRYGTVTEVPEPLASALIARGQAETLHTAMTHKIKPKVKRKTKGKK